MRARLLEELSSYVRSYLRYIPGALELYVFYDVENYISKHLQLDGGALKKYDGVLVAILRSIFCEGYEVFTVLTNELQIRGLHNLQNEFNRVSTDTAALISNSDIDYTSGDSKAGNSSSDTDYNVREAEDVCEVSIDDTPFIYRAEWNIRGISAISNQDENLRLVSSRFRLDNDLTRSALRLMLTKNASHSTVHVTIAEAVSVSMRCHVADTSGKRPSAPPFDEDIVGHNFANEPWASLTLPNELHEATDLCVRVTVNTIGDARRKGTDIDALPSMSNLLSGGDTSGTTALRELLSKNQLSSANTDIQSTALPPPVFARGESLW